MSWHIIPRKETYVLRSPQVDQATRYLKAVVLSRFPSSNIEIPSQTPWFRIEPLHFEDPLVGKVHMY